MNIYAKKGAKVRYTGDGGYVSELEHANKYLKMGDIYTISYIDVGDWYTNVYLEEIPNQDFNSAHFDDVVESDNLLIKPPLLIADIGNVTSWDEWLVKIDTKLEEAGYQKSTQSNRNCDFCYWKSFKNEKEKIYQIGILFYYLRNNKNHDPNADRIDFMYECMISNSDRIDMTVFKNIYLTEFEGMSETFYKSMLQYCR